VKKPHPQNSFVRNCLHATAISLYRERTLSPIFKEGGGQKGIIRGWRVTMLLGSGERKRDQIVESSRRMFQLGEMRFTKPPQRSSKSIWGERLGYLFLGPT